MRRLGAILMMLGANIMVGSLVAAFWLASLDCAEGACDDGVMGQFFQRLASVNGLVFWLVIVIGLLIFWRGRRIRAG